MSNEDRIVFRQGKKVHVRPVIEEDLPVMVVTMNDEETTVFLSTSHPISKPNEHEWFERLQKKEDWKKSS